MDSQTINDIFPFTDTWDAKNPMYVGMASQTHRPTKKYPYTAFTLEWIVAGCGFGEITFSKRVWDDFWYCNDEYMGREFVFDIAQAWLNRNPKRKHGSSRRWTKRLVNHQEILKDILSGKDRVLISSERWELANSGTSEKINNNEDGESDDND